MRFVALATALVLTACSSENITGSPEEVTFAPELEIDLASMTRTASGLFIKDFTIGTGDVVAPGAVVTVQFTGWLPNGRVFDTTAGDGFPAVLDLDDTILGWQEGIPGMQVGGHRQLVIPPELGFGDRGTPSGSIPPDVSLVFEIILEEVDNGV